MNIKEAKEQIKNAMISYFTKDEMGEYIVPIEKQRPVFLMGPPGIGKTAIMEQIASEMGVGLVSYSMTHHTRQSALGLPFISRKAYGGKEFDISEYTMSEIIASVYDMMEDSGVKEGILFLDEINCVSETLAPVMLQFLQYKIFGRHHVPEGWVVVTAGNPPEFNNSVREFDIVTWDRLKRIDIEPNFDVWKEYAYEKGVHPAVLTYLDIKKSDFYSIKTTVDGKSFVTARGWDDLSQMIKLYEMNNLTVDEKLISQYIQDARIAKDFAIYYDLFLKYKSDYQVDSIFDGKATSEIIKRAENSKFDERISLIGLLLDAASYDAKEVMAEDARFAKLMDAVKKISTASSSEEMVLGIDRINNKYEGMLDSGVKSGSISKGAQKELKKLIGILDSWKASVSSASSKNDALLIIKKEFEQAHKSLKKNSDSAKTRLSNMFKFIDEVFPGGQEMLIVVTELTQNQTTSGFISKYGCEEYFKHNRDLLLHDRQKEIEDEIKALNLL